MKVIKRNGTEVEFDMDKIFIAVGKANAEVDKKYQLEATTILKNCSKLQDEIFKLNRAISVEEIQDMVEEMLMGLEPHIARAYVRYRYDREKARKVNTTDDAILSLIELENEEVKQENSNKNSTIIPTQRDYIRGEVSKDLCKRIILPKDIVKAHEEGIIHIHDMDYLAQHSHNCDLVNMKDMLENGTVISNVKIERPHTFSTACNIATQIVAQVASCQYGGQSLSLAHLAPFVDSSRQKYLKEYGYLKNKMTDLEFEVFIEDLVKRDITKGVQIMQYQVITLQTTNGWKWLSM